jgi:hypothetical protein
MQRHNELVMLLRTFVMAAMMISLAACGGGNSGSSSPPSNPYGVCPSTGLTSSANTLNLEGNCAIVGNVSLSGSAALTMTNGILSIAGNVVLNDSSQLTVTSGGLTFPQTNYSQYSITLNGNSQLTMTGSTLVTNATQQNNFSMDVNANDSSVANFENSTLNPNTGSWLLGSFSGQSTLNVNNSQNVPTEIYPNDAAKISISSGSGSTVWLNFPSGSDGTIEIPTRDSQGNFNFSFGPVTGIAYSVNISSSAGSLGLNSYPNSTMIVNGHGTSGANDLRVVFGYYIQNNTAPVSLNGLTGGSNVTQEFTDQGRILQLNNVNLGPLSWQVYVSQSNNLPVSVTNSQINEIAALTNGLLNISNCVLQLAVTEAGGSGSLMNISGTQIWSQSIQAVQGGQMMITNSQLHGNFISATGTGSSIAMTNDVEERNGVPPQSCAAVDGLPPNNNGVPLCNPYNPLYQCSQVSATGGGTITGTPPCPAQ